MEASRGLQDIGRWNMMGREVIRMIECKDYAKFEGLSELTEAIEIGLDIEFTFYGKRYNISWRNDKPFICECPDGATVFYSDAQAMLDEYKINNIPLKKLWKDMKVLSM